MAESTMSDYPIIIQGGMGAGISDWRLARAVSRLGQLGVVSGTALDQILARRFRMAIQVAICASRLITFLFPP